MSLLPIFDCTPARNVQLKSAKTIPNNIGGPSSRLTIAVSVDIGGTNVIL